LAELTPDPAELEASAGFYPSYAGILQGKREDGVPIDALETHCAHEKSHPACLGYNAYSAFTPPLSHAPLPCIPPCQRSFIPATIMSHNDSLPRNAASMSDRRLPLATHCSPSKSPSHSPVSPASQPVRHCTISALSLHGLTHSRQNCSSPTAQLTSTSHERVTAPTKA